MPQPKKDYSGFDRMSTEMLEEILRGDFELSSDEESDMDAILYIMEVIAKRKKKESRGRPDAEQAWNIFNENYRSNHAVPWYEDDDDKDCDVKSETAEQTTVKKKRRLSRRVMGIAASVVIIIGCTFLTADAFGYNIWQIIAQWTTETFGFASGEGNLQIDSEDGTTSQYRSLQEALDAYDIKEKIVPTWIPKGYALVSIEVTSSPEVTCFVALYQSEYDDMFIKINHSNGDHYRAFEKDDSAIEEFDIQGIKHYIMSDLGYESAVWINGGNECSITASVSRSEINRMIQSIYER